MGELLAALFAIGLMLAILRLAVSPGRRGLSRRWFPRSDEGFGAILERTPAPRGFTLAALATAPVAGFAADADTRPAFLAVMIAGVASALFYVYAPNLTGTLLGIFGSLTAFAGAVGSACTDPSGSRTIPVVVIVLIGIVVFFIAAAVRASSAVVLIRTSPGSVSLAAFGVLSLGVLVGGPFGLDLIELTGFGGSLAVAIGLYLLVCIGAGLLPAFTTSVLGAALLAAHVVVDFAIGDPCSDRRFILIATLLGFVAVWGVARRFRR